MQTTSEYMFNERFGRSDFKEVSEHVLSEAVRYIMKYLEKDGGKIVCSRGLPQYFISDIMDEDIAALIGIEDKELLLFDEFYMLGRRLPCGASKQRSNRPDVESKLKGAILLRIAQK